MCKVFNQNIKEAMEAAQHLNRLAERGECECMDDSCAVLYGVIRDCAHQIKVRASKEMEQHIRQGVWDEV